MDDSERSIRHAYVQAVFDRRYASADFLRSYLPETEIGFEIPDRYRDYYNAAGVIED